MTNEPIPNAPAIPGLRFRHFRDDADYAALLAVNTASKIADGQDYDLHTLDSLRHVYGPAPNHDPARDVLIAEVDGTMVAFVRVFWDRELDGSLVYTHVGFVLPDWRRRGLGRALIAWSAQHARTAAARAGADQAYLSAETREGQTDLAHLLEAAGYTPVRYSYHMETPDLDHIPDVPLPAGLEVRPVRPEHDRAIWEAAVEAFRDHWGASEPQEGDFERSLRSPQHQPELWVVAWDGDHVAGSIQNYINHEYNARVGRKIGYTEDISVRRPWRRRGLARALLARSMQVHKAHGMLQTALSVDTQNPTGALALYSSMGYQVIASETEYRKAL